MSLLQGKEQAVSRALLDAQEAVAFVNLPIGQRLLMKLRRSRYPVSGPAFVLESMTAERT